MCSSDLRDKEHDDFLAEKGWIVLHFWGHQIENDLEGCINEILSYVPKTK